MKNIYLVVSKGGSNHIKILAAFGSESLAGIYLRSLGKSVQRPHIMQVPYMDGTPEMNKIVLEGDLPEGINP